MAFLSSTDYSSRAEELYEVFNREIDFVRTIHNAAPDYLEIFEYMDQKLGQYTITMPNYGDIKWVPVSLLRHIYKDDTPFLKRLNRFLKLAQKCGEAKALSTGEMLAYRMGDLGKIFISWVGCFILLINDEEDLNEAQTTALAIGGPSRETADPRADDAGPSQETSWGSVAYPMGEDEALILSAEGPDSSPTLVIRDANFVPLPEQELSTLSTIVIDDEEFVFMHDLEKACKICHDECLSMLATQGKIPLDDTEEGPLSHQCIPSTADLTTALPATVQIVQAVIAESEQANVTDEQFQAVQSTLVANQTPLAADVAGGGDVAAIRVEERSSIDLTTRNDDHLETVRYYCLLFLNSTMVFCAMLTLYGLAGCRGDGRMGAEDGRNKGALWAKLGVGALYRPRSCCRFCNFSCRVLHECRL